MLFALALAAVAIAGGAVVTYSFDDDAPLVARLCAGACIGFAALGILSFVLASFFTLNFLVLILSAVLVSSPLLLVASAHKRQHLRDDIRQAVHGVRRAVFHPEIRTAIYLAFYVVAGIMLWFVFDRAMLELPDGIYTGVRNNYGDLPFHLSIITSFTDGANFPPEDPTWAGARFTYPFIADFVAACFVRAGAGLRHALFLENWVLAISLTGLLHRFALKLTRDWIAGLIAPVLVLFSGGLGWWHFFADSEWSEKGIVGVLTSLEQNYTITPDTGYRWGNSLTTLLIPQRSILLGLPIAIVVFMVWWNSLDRSGDLHIAQPKRKAPKKAASKTELRSSFRSSLAKQMALAGLIAGLLPLVHAHSFMVVMGVGSGVAVIAGRSKWREWAVFFMAAILVAAPQMWWVTRDSSVQAGSFFAFHFGWDKGEENFFWFWLKNTGMFIPLLVIAVVWLFRKKNDVRSPVSSTLLLFYLPFTLCFVIPNLIKLAPWQWDNIKVIFYWFVASAPLVALLLARLMRGRLMLRAASVCLLLVLTLAGVLDVWSVASRAREFRIYDADGIQFAEMVKQKTPPRATILHAPTFNTPIFLTGRRTVMGYPGHIDSHGIESKDRLREITELYAGSSRALALIDKYRVDYIVVGPQEREMETLRSYSYDPSFFTKYRLVGEKGEYRLYEISRR